MNINNDAIEFTKDVSDRLFAWDYLEGEKVLALSQEFELDIDTIVEGIRELFEIEQGYYLPGNVSFLELFNRFLVLFLQRTVFYSTDLGEDDKLCKAFSRMIEGVNIDDGNISYYLDDEVNFWKAWKNATEEQRNNIENNKVLKYFKDFIVTKESEVE